MDRASEQDRFKIAIADLNRALHENAGNLYATYATFARRAAETLDAPRTNVWLYTDADRNMLRCIASYSGQTDAAISRDALDLTSYPAYHKALTEERVIVASDVLTHPATQELTDDYLVPKNIRAMMDAPIRDEGHVVGVICVEQTGEPRQWTDAEASFVATLSDFATIALSMHHRTEAESALVRAQKMESLGRLAGGIAHDFNNLLTVIAGATETLQVKLRNAGIHEDRLLELIADAGVRGSRLTRNLLAFGGQQSMEFDLISTRDLLQDIKQLTESTIREDIALRFVPTEEEYWIHADQNQLEQVILNLMINAMDAMPEGGRLAVELLTPDSDGMLGIAITDTGHGMPPQVLEHIFDPFFTTKGDSGTGLGLSISVGIIKQHDGRIEVVRSDGQGTRFEIRLPVGDRPKPRIAAPAQEEDLITSRERKTVLFVEDDPRVRDVVTEMMVTLNLNVIVAEDANDALNLLQQQPVDLLVSDIVMPDLRGPQLYQQALATAPTLRALFISGYSDEIIKQEAIDDGHCAYLAKPFTIRQLNQAMTELTAV